ncbi:MAG TPA: AMP-dependent synthetase/ligase [Pseudonocardia sp.]|jgi:long-chain acyl-CoA synthetase
MGAVHAREPGPTQIARAVAGDTLPRYLRRTVENRPGAVALRWRDGAGGYASWSWTRYAELSCRVAAGLRAAGVRPGDRVVLLIGNEPAFHLADTGAMLVGATPVSVYNTAAASQIVFVANHCGASVAVVAARFLETFRRVQGSIPTLRRVIVVSDANGSVDAVAGAVPFDELLSADPLDFDAAVERVDPEDLATLVYTSGTTGAPKGVMIRHRNVCASLESWTRALGTSMTGWRFISYMPMAHIAERALFSHYMHLREGTEVSTCPDVALFSDYLLDVRPDFAYLPPRLLEKMRSSVYSRYASGAARTELDAELDTALRASLGGANTDSPILDAVRTDLGLEQCRVLLTGAAPIPVAVFDFFLALGLPLSECYGMSECTGGASWSPRAPKAGTVGRAVPGVDIRLAPDGEILLNGANVVSGYLDNPAATAAAFTEDGWLRTGDIGSFDDEGYLRIIDRKKDLIITSGGHNVSPVSLENRLKAHPLLSNACVVGDRRRYVAALLVLDLNAALRWMREVDGTEAGTEAGTEVSDLSAHPGLLAELERWVSEVNADFARPEQIKRFRLLAADWTSDGGELTPTMKLRRQVVADRYAEEIEALYA